MTRLAESGRLFLAALVLCLVSTSLQESRVIAPIPLPPPPPVNQACAAVSCVVGQECRIISDCDTCEARPQCVPAGQLEIDNECQKNGYDRAVIAQSSSNPSVYSKVKCSWPSIRNECPPNSVCVDDFHGEGTCCTGKRELDPCGGCKTGYTCVTQGLVPKCVPSACANCQADEECIESPRQLLCVGCPTVFQCAKRNRCGDEPCPSGQRCLFAGTVCVDPGPGQPIDPERFGCFDRFQCQKVDDMCGGCQPGFVCVDTGIRCVQPPCPSFECQPEDKCGNRCTVGQTCLALYPPCPPPPPCDLTGAPCIDDEDYCPPQYVCRDDHPIGPPPPPSPPPPPPPTTTTTTTLPPPPPPAPICPLRCPPNYRCQFVTRNCYPFDRNCNRTPYPKCVRVRPTSPILQPQGCPSISGRGQPWACALQRSFQRILRPCTSDSNCGVGRKCCKSRCGRKICVRTRPVRAWP